MCFQAFILYQKYLENKMTDSTREKSYGDILKSQGCQHILEYAKGFVE